MYSLRPSTLARRLPKRREQHENPVARKRHRLIDSSDEAPETKSLKRSRKRSVSRKEEIMLKTLPSEIRQKILECALTLPYAIGIHAVDHICLNQACVISSDPRKQEVKAALKDLIGIFQVDRKLRQEAFDVLIRSNAWRLEGTKFAALKAESLDRVTKTPISHLANENVLSQVLTSALTRLSLSDLLCRDLPVHEIMHFYMRACLYHDGIRECILDQPRDPHNGDLRTWFQNEISGGRFTSERVLSERDVSEGCKNQLDKLVNAQIAGTCSTQSLTLEILMHEARRGVKTWLNQCGLALTFTLKFHQPRSSDDSVPILAHHSLVNRGFTEPKRDIFAPLAKMRNIRYITVSRKWVLKAACPSMDRRGTKNGQESEIKSVELVPMELKIRFKGIIEMLTVAGKELHVFKGAGLQEANIKPQDLLQIFENQDIEDIAEIEKGKYKSVILRRPVVCLVPPAVQKDIGH